MPCWGVYLCVYLGSSFLCMYVCESLGFQFSPAPTLCSEALSGRVVWSCDRSWRNPPPTAASMCCGVGGFQAEAGRWSQLDPPHVLPACPLDPLSPRGNLAPALQIFGGPVGVGPQLGGIWLGAMLSAPHPGMSQSCWDLPPPLVPTRSGLS